MIDNIKKIILISAPTEKVMVMVDKEFINSDLKGKNFVYLPVQGDDPRNDEYTPIWESRVEKDGGNFIYVDNSKSFEDSVEERKNVENADAIIITGGNTFDLLNNLRTSGIIDSLKKFFEKDEIKFLGMSAGAILLAESIEFANDHNFSFGYDENNVGLTDLSGLGVIDFVPIVHFNPELDNDALRKYKNESGKECRTITNDEYIILEI